MAYTNSPLIVHTNISPNRSRNRNHRIDRITPHCVVGQCTAEGLGEWFSDTATQASSNYGIDKSGRVGMYVEEKDRSWCSSNRDNDHRAITIECASDTSEPYAMKDAVYASLIELCADICKRNGKTKLLWFADKDKTLAYAPATNEMVITVHRWFANKSCPGNWLYSRLGDLAAKVTAALNDSDEGRTYPEKLTEGYYRVRKSWKDSKSQVGAYRILANAKKAADKNPGTFVFTNDGVAVYPTTETYRVHTVVKGDSLWNIAQKYLGDGSRYPEIKELNKLKSNTIYSGWKLKIPN